MRSTSAIFAVVGLFMVLGCGQAPSETVEVVVEEAAVAEPVVEARYDVVYTCACGPDCDCGAVAVAPGTCGCGTELVASHLLKVEGNEGLLCACESGCTCEIDAEDATKCTCGKDVKRVSFEGKGLYYCNCGGSCTCNHVTAEPGSCACGMELVTS